MSRSNKNFADPGNFVKEENIQSKLGLDFTTGTPELFTKPLWGQKEEDLLAQNQLVLTTEEGQFKWHFYTPNDLSNLVMKDLSINFVQISEDGFEMDIFWDAEEAGSCIRANDIICILNYIPDLKNCIESVVGFALFKEAISSVGKIFYLSKICLSKITQGQRLASHLLSWFKKKYSVSILSAMTQNPAVLKLIDTNETTFPFNGCYDSIVGSAIIEGLTNRGVLSDFEHSIFINKQGILKGLYKQRLGKYPDTNIDKYNTIDRNTGDAFLITSIYNINE
jgi:hypothetical protein